MTQLSENRVQRAEHVFLLNTVAPTENNENKQALKKEKLVRNKHDVD